MSSPAVKLLCVLRQGGDFDWRHALRLMQQWAVHAPRDVDLVCLTDSPDLLGASPLSVAAPLAHDWPGFFAKIEAFRLPGPCLYMDLDVNVLADLAPLVDLAREHEFIVCRDFASPAGHVVNTSVMAWRDDVSELYREFAQAPVACMDLYNDPGRWQEPGRGWGDQGFVRDHRRGPMIFWQDLAPGSVVSFKAVRYQARRPDGAIVLASHGQPRPWEKGGADETVPRWR